MDCFRVDLVPTHRILLNGSADQISAGFGPKQIEVEIRYDERQLRMRVRDDGKGIDPQVLSDHGRERHFILRGLQERAKLIGGKLTLWSKLDSGTEVTRTRRLLTCSAHGSPRSLRSFPVKIRD